MNTRRPYKNTESVHIREVLHAIISTCRKETHTELDLIRQIWQTSFPPTVTDHARPSALKDGILLVTVKSSTVAHQLRFQVRDMIQHINQALGHARIREIKLKTGNF